MESLIDKLVNTSEGRLFLILLIMALPRFIDTVRDLVRNRGVVDKQAGELALADAKAITDERKRQDEVLGQWISLVATLAVRIEKLSTSIETAAAEDRVGHSMEAERLKLREVELAANRTLIQAQTDAVAGFPPALAASVKEITADIQKVSVDVKAAFVEAVGSMGDDLTSKLDEQLTAQTNALRALQQSVDALRQSIEDKITPVPAQFEQIATTIQEVKTVIDDVKSIYLEIGMITKRLDAIAPAPSLLPVTLLSADPVVPTEAQS